MKGNFEENRESGFIALWRSMKRHWLWEPHRKRTRLEAWYYMLLAANHRAEKIMVERDILDLKRGEFLTSQHKLAEEWRWSRSAVKNFLDTLEMHNMIKYETTTKYTIISIHNYSKYNDIRSENISEPRYEPRSSHANDSKSETYEGEASTVRTTGTTTVPKPRLQNELTSIPQNIPFNELKDNNLQGLPIHDTSRDAGHDLSHRKSTDELPADINNNNSYYNLNTTTTTTKPDVFEKFGDGVENVASSPPTPSPSEGELHQKITAMSILEIDECLNHFMSSQITLRYRQQIMIQCHWLGQEELMKDWGRAFNRYLTSKLVTQEALSRWCTGFGSWLGFIPDRQNQDPNKVDVTKNLHKQINSNGRQSAPTGAGSRQERNATGPSQSKYGGISSDQTREFFSRSKKDTE